MSSGNVKTKRAGYGLQSEGCKRRNARCLGPIIQCYLMCVHVRVSCLSGSWFFRDHRGCIDRRATWVRGAQWRRWGRLKSVGRRYHCHPHIWAWRGFYLEPFFWDVMAISVHLVQQQTARKRASKYVKDRRDAGIGICEWYGRMAGHAENNNTALSRRQSK